MRPFEPRLRPDFYDRIVEGFRRTDFVLACLIAVVLLAGLTSYKLVRQDTWLGDSAMYFQATENVARRGIPVSEVQAAIVDYMYANDFLSKHAAQIAAAPDALFASPARYREYSLLAGHAYFVLYPIGMLTAFMPVAFVLMLLFMVTFVGALLLLYAAVRRSDVPAGLAALFCLLVAFHPAWWESVLGGQFYPDRLFVFAGLVFMFVATRRDDVPRRIPNALWLVLAGIACASINERGAIVAGLFLLAHTVLYRSGSLRNALPRGLFGLALVGYGYFVLKVMLGGNPEYGSFFPKTLAGLIAMVSQPSFAHLVALFLLVNAPLLLLACFEWRAAAIAAFLMLPNIFGNIGGAEKVGWTTHYPSFFLPSLLWAAALGYQVAVRRFARSYRGVGAYAAMVALLAYVILLDPDSVDPIGFGPSHLARSAPQQLDYYVSTYLGNPRAREELGSAANAIRQAIPPGTTVSSVEAGMTLLYPNRSIQYFPKDIDNADYAVLGAQVIGGKIVYNGVLDYAGPGEQQKLSELTFARMKRDGYDLDHPLLFPAFDGLAVVKRLH